MASAVPNTIDQFIAVATAALPSSAMVWFGKPLSKYTAPVLLQVVEVLNGRQRPAELGPTYRREEEFNLSCILSCWAGDVDFTGRKNDTFANFALLTTAIANNPTLNGAVRFSEPTAFSFTPDTTPEGFSIGVLPFNVTCQVRINSLT